MFTNHQLVLISISPPLNSCRGAAIGKAHDLFPTMFVYLMLSDIVSYTINEDNNTLLNPTIIVIMLVDDATESTRAEHA